MNVRYLRLAYGLAGYREQDYMEFVKYFEVEGHATGDMEAIYAGSFETIFRVMKEVNLQPHLFDNQDLDALNFTGDIDDIDSLPEFMSENLTLLRMKKPERSTILERLSVTSILQPFIPYCILENKWSKPPLWGSKKIATTLREEFSQFCTLFRPTLTDKGVCQTFNGVKSTTLLKPSRFVDAFTQI